MKKYLLLALMLICIGTSTRASEPAVLTISSCYQYIAAPTAGGNYNMISGVPIVFGSTFEADFSSVEIYEIIGSSLSYWGTINCGTPVTLTDGFSYLVRAVPNPNGAITPYPSQINLVQPELAINDNDNDGCIGFNELLSLDFAESIPGLCTPPVFSYVDPLTGVTVVGHQDVYIDEGTFCTPPNPYDWIGAKHCTTFTASVEIEPCGGTTCPPFTLTKSVEMCCNKCQPYGGIANGRIAPKKEVFEITPNPAINRLSVTTSDAGILEIYNVTGQVMLTRPLEGNVSVSIDVSSLPDGNYICKYYMAGKPGITKQLQVIR